VPQFRIAEAARLLGTSDDTVPRRVDGTAVLVDQVMAQVEMQCGPHRVVSVMSSEAVRGLDLEPGSLAVAVVKSTNVVVEIPGGSS
jgi:molybdopterin-binding protein